MKKSRKGKSGTANVHNMLINSTATEIPGSLAGPRMRVLLANNFSGIFMIGLLINNCFNYCLTTKCS